SGGANPCSSTRMSYTPGRRPVMRKRPRSSVVSEATAPVSTLVAVTAAPGSTALCASTTAPSSAAVVVCAARAAVKRRMSMRLLRGEIEIVVHVAADLRHRLLDLLGGRARALGHHRDRDVAGVVRHAAHACSLSGKWA